MRNSKILLLSFTSLQPSYGIYQFVQIVILNSRMRIENIEFAQTVITLEKKMKSLMLMNWLLLIAMEID